MASYLMITFLFVSQATNNGGKTCIAERVMKNSMCLKKSFVVFFEERIVCLSGHKQRREIGLILRHMTQNRSQR